MKYLRLFIYLFSVCFALNISFAVGLGASKKEEKALPFNVKEVISKVNHRQPDKALKHREYRKHQKANLAKDPVTVNFQSRIPTPKIPGSDSGEFLIDTSINYIPDENGQFSPAVAFDGTNYFVVWGDYDLETVVGARVSPTGDVLDITGLIIVHANGGWQDEGPSVAFGDSNYLVVWSGYDPDGIMGVRVSTAGIVLDSTPIPVCATYPNSSELLYSRRYCTN
jgi:hypothetical protein